MKEFYGVKGSNRTPLSAPTSGQLVAVRAEEEEEILRGQICEVLEDKIKVRPLEKMESARRSDKENAITVIPAGFLCGPRLFRDGQQNQSV